MTNQNQDSAEREIPYFTGASGSRERGQDGTSRRETGDLVVQHHKSIIEEVGSVFVTAKDVLEFLHEAGHLKHVTKSNGVGDVLGAKHFNLPFARRGAKRLYLLPAVAWAQEQRAEFSALTPEEKVAQVGKHEKELKEIIGAAQVKKAFEASRRSRENPAQTEGD